MLTDITVHTRAQGILGQLEGHAYICCQQVQDLSMYFEAGLLIIWSILDRNKVIIE